MQFEQLVDDAIIHILGFCDGESILRMTESCKSINKLIGSSAKLMRKVTLKPPIEEPKQIEELHKIIVASDRQYKKLEIKDIICLADTTEAEELLDILGETVINLSIGTRYCYVSGKDLARVLLAMQNIIKLKLSHNRHDFFTQTRMNLSPIEDATVKQLELSEFNFLANLEHLAIDIHYASILELFRECKMLKSCEIYFDGRQNGEMIDNFLIQQKQLKHLTIKKQNMSHLNTWENSQWLSFSFKLKSLALHDFALPTEIAPIFFKQQTELETLEVHFNQAYFEDTNAMHKTIKAILELPRLKELEIDLEMISVPEGLFNDLSNNTIKILEIKHFYVNFISLANSLYAAEQIIINGYFEMSRLRLDVLEKTTFKGHNLYYTLPNIPEDREKFESAISNLIQRSSKEITFVQIGHENWLQHQEFQLSFEFCKSIIDLLPCLSHLELYNVQNCYDELKAYLEPKDINAKLNNEELDEEN